MTEEDSLVAYPWEVISLIMGAHGREVRAKSLAWPGFLVVPADTRVRHDGGLGEIPGRMVAPGTRRCRIVELPGPAMGGSSALHDQVVVLAEGEAERAVELHYTASDAPPTDARNRADGENSFERLLNLAVFVSRKCLFTDGRMREQLGWNSLVSYLQGYSDEDTARYALIVELAESRLAAQLGRITSNPKRVLRRVRELEHLSRVQEVDNHCLRWITRQPGTALQERAGPKQRVLAVKREETIDTLENRVVRHCAKLAQDAATRYLEGHRHIAVSARKRTVENFRRQVGRLVERATFDGVRRLGEPCRAPNYTLLENGLYRGVWQAYDQLVKQEDLRSRLWRHRRVLWAEVCGLAVSSMFLGVAGEGRQGPIEVVRERLVEPRRRFEGGRMIFDDFLAGPFLVHSDDGNSGTLYSVDSRGLTHLGDELGPLGILNADCLFLWLPEDGSRVVIPLYAILRPDQLTEDGLLVLLDRVFGSLSTQLGIAHSALGHWHIGGAWVFMEAASDEATAEIWDEKHDGRRLWAVELPPHPHGWRALARPFCSKLTALFSHSDMGGSG